MKMAKRKNLWFDIRSIIFVMSLILLIIILPSIFSKNASCDNISLTDKTFYGIFVSAFCNYGLKGIMIFVLIIIIAIIAIDFIIRNINKSKK